MQAIKVIMGKDMSAQVRLYLTWISNYNPQNTPTIITAINIAWCVTGDKPLCETMMTSDVVVVIWGLYSLDNKELISLKLCVSLSTVCLLSLS